MAISKKTLDLINLALKDKVLTQVERQIIVNAALEMGISKQEIEAYLSHATDERIRSIYSKEEIFRLIITDKDGVPVAGCGKFVFKTMIGHTALVKSEGFCHENQFKAIETCRYLRDHKEDLSFIVEKLN